VFQDAGFPLFTVASTLDELQTTGSMDGNNMNGLKFHADHTFETAPQPKVILMGAQAAGTPAKLEWIRKAAADADVVISVCTGAFLLARTGLLDGLSATTHPNSYDRFAKEFPNIKLVRGTRFVDNGKFVTAGGLSAGIDTALHIVSRYNGISAARQVAEYMQYHSQSWA
jgi:transcriptional regulator GlxA family with amidase domain